MHLSLDFIIIIILFCLILLDKVDGIICLCVNASWRMGLL